MNDFLPTGYYGKGAGISKLVNDETIHHFKAKKIFFITLLVKALQILIRQHTKNRDFNEKNDPSSISY